MVYLKAIFCRRMQWMNKWIIFRNIRNFISEIKYTLTTRAVRRSRSTGAGAPAYFAGAGAGAGVGKLRQKLRQTKLGKIISYFNELLVMEKLN
jgi:hypothetical protein